MAGRPNILYLHSHDTGRFIQPYGFPVHTPALQKLAEEGVLFRNAFTPSPTCSPSRGCLLTGQTAHSNGLIGLAHRGFSLKDYRQHIIHTLRSHGYMSVLAGIQHIAHGHDAWKTIGYDEFLGPACEEQSADAHLRAATFLQRKHPTPFFLSVGFFETHRPFPESNIHDDARYIQPPPPLPDTPETRSDTAHFKQSARTLDQKIQFVLDALDESGLAKNTLVICTTDHGIAFPHMKCNLEDAGTGVMMLMRGPGGFNGGKVVDSMVSQLDVFPTLCELLSINPPQWLDGKSLLPLVRGTAEKIHDELFFEINYHAAFEPMRAVRSDRHKYIVRYDPRDTPVLPNCDPGPSKSLLLHHGWADCAPASEALYDLIFDPYEMHNLASDPGYKTVLEEMKERLLKWQLETSDPLLSPGGIPLPLSALCDNRDGSDPGSAPLPAGTR